MMTSSGPAVPPDGAPTVTRFAPSPTGDLHLGNVRTALFSFLLARQAGGRFVVRIEDTDAERSRAQYCARQLADLRWLGLDWDAGPDREDGAGPYRQSQRTGLYERYFRALIAAAAVYECFCSPLELEVAHRAQLAAHRPPRYAGTCRDLSAAERERRRAQGIRPTLRLRVPPGRLIWFTDLVHGPQAFQSDDIGDFVVRRADGSASFFFSNAVDDAAMGITHVLRGEDHLANTPRQLLVLQALGLSAPVYGHVALLVGAGGAPLSKRDGATTVCEFRERGYTAAALLNHLFRLGHSTPERALLDLAGMARAFDTVHLGRAPAHFQEAQLAVWQKEAVRQMTPPQLGAWLAGALPAGVLPPDLPQERALAFAQAVRPNIVLPGDALPWAQVVFGGPPQIAAGELPVIEQAGRAYFAAAAGAAAAAGNDLPAILAALRAATGVQGQALYLPLRLALTGLSHGPELGPLLAAMPPQAARERLARFA
ncbi:MAG TPA: glutamate--tRNA ligase [Steroidobacteraceae bacterium]|nr:glutamate--tRNA ligase [Steroidobacteraceae bacterium]